VPASVRERGAWCPRPPFGVETGCRLPSARCVRERAAGGERTVRAGRSEHAQRLHSVPRKDSPARSTRGTSRTPSGCWPWSRWSAGGPTARSFATPEPANAPLGLPTCRRQRRERAHNARLRPPIGAGPSTRGVRFAKRSPSEACFTEWSLIEKLRRNRDGVDSGQTFRVNTAPSKFSAISEREVSN
jgi:hypothetical protein